MGRSAIPTEQDLKAMKDIQNGKKTVEEVAKELGDTPEQVKQAYLLYLKIHDKSGYGANVQKMISFKGTIRELFLKARNRHGGTYPLKVINLYMKPGTQRYYDNGVVEVDKDKIRRGNESEGYHPDKTMWIDKIPRVRPRSQKVSTPLEGVGPSGEIILRKKGKSKRKLKLRKKPCKCLHKRKK